MIHGFLFWVALLFQGIWPYIPPVPTAGATPPSFVSPATSGVEAGQAGNTFPLTAITTSAGNILWVVAGTRTTVNECNAITGATSKIGGVASGDTFVQVPSSSNPSNSNTCAISFVAFNVHAGSGNYVINLNGTASIPSYVLYTIQQFTPGSLTGAVDTTCTGSATSGTTVTCGTAMTPATSLELVLGGVFTYDPTTVVAGSGYTIGTGGSLNSAGNGGSGGEYLIANPTSGTYTPSFSSTGAGDPSIMIGALIK